MPDSYSTGPTSQSASRGATPASCDGATWTLDSVVVTTRLVRQRHHIAALRHALHQTARAAHVSGWTASQIIGAARAKACATSIAFPDTALARPCVTDSNSLQSAMTIASDIWRSAGPRLADVSVSISSK